MVPQPHCLYRTRATYIDNCLIIYPAANWVRIWPFVCSDSSNYLNRCRLVVNWTLRNKLWNRNTPKLVHERRFNISSVNLFMSRCDTCHDVTQKFTPIMLTYCYLLTPCDDILVDQHWLSNGDGVLPDDTKRLHKSTDKKCFVVQTQKCSKITLLKLSTYFPRANVLINQYTSGNVWLRTQHCGYWCSGANAPGHQ